MGCNINDYFWRVEILDQNSAIWVRQICDLIPVNHLIILRLIEQSEISFFVLVEFEVLLHLLKRS